MPRPIFLRSNRRVTWVSLSAEGVLEILFHEFQVRGPEAETPLVLGSPGPCPPDDGVACLVLKVSGNGFSLLSSQHLTVALSILALRPLRVKALQRAWAPSVVSPHVLTTLSSSSHASSTRLTRLVVREELELEVETMRESKH